MATPFQTTPDQNASGLLKATPNAHRYDHVNQDPLEAPSVVATMIPKDARVLDVGCGGGAVATVVRGKCNATVVGVEPDPEHVAMTRERGFEVIEGYLTSEVVEQLGKFDVVLFADVLEHLPNPSEILQISLDALKPGGAIVISIPNVAHWSVRWELLWGHFDYQPSGIMDATHLRWFTAESLALFLQSNGLRADRIAYTAGFTLPAYERVWPWRSIHPWRRAKLVRLGLKRWPKLFGCQHVVRATLA